MRDQSTINAVRWLVTLWTEDGPPDNDASGIEVEVEANSEEDAIARAKAQHLGEADWGTASRIGS